MKKITICGKEHHFYGLLEAGRRIVTEGSDFILRPLLRFDNGGWSAKAAGDLFPDDQEPVQIRSKEFFPWKRIEITKADMPEVRSRTEAHKRATLADFERREIQELLLSTVLDFRRNYGPREGEIQWTDEEASKRWLNWIRDAQRSYQEMRRPYEGGHVVDGEPTGYNEASWIDEFGDDLRADIWIKIHGQGAYTELSDETFSLRLKVAGAMKFPIGTVRGWVDCGQFLDRIRFEVTYPRAVVYLEGYDELSHSVEALNLIHLACQYTSAKGNKEAANPSGSDIRQPRTVHGTSLKLWRRRQVREETGWSDEYLNYLISEEKIKPIKEQGKKAFFDPDEITQVVEQLKNPPQSAAKRRIRFLALAEL